VLAAAIGLALAVRTNAAARYFESQWKSDSVAFNRPEPSQLPRQARPSAWVGLPGLLLAFVVAIRIWAARM